MTILVAVMLAASAATVRPAKDVVWMDVPVVKGAQIAILWGDPKTGPYGCLKKFPPGAALPLHSHAHDQRTVVIAGAVTFRVDGQPDQELGPQAYSLVPAGVKHAATCGPAECVVFEEQPGPADFILAETKAPAGVAQ